MNMYSQLLGSALDHRAGDPLSPGEALSHLVLCRSRFAKAASLRTGSGWASVAIADQLAYDVALIALAKGIGIPWDIRNFDRPEEERTRLEGALRSQGLDVDAVGNDEPPGYK
jgi:hypothetical protein